jgi:hypothetical protein
MADFWGSPDRETSFEDPAALTEGSGSPDAYPSDPPVAPEALSSATGGGRLVRCQYRQDPHPLDDECTDVTDVDPSTVARAAEAWAAAGNGDLIADLRRVAKLVDPPPTTEEVRHGGLSHRVRPGMAPGRTMSAGLPAIIVRDLGVGDG